MVTASRKKVSTVTSKVGAKRLPARSAPAYGGPLQLDISLIDEDPNQPRTKNNPGFAPASLAELATTIAARGVKTPISVRDNPALPGRYLINHGARRFRGSKLAGKTKIPSFIDNDYNDADQVIENLQRNELTAREIADYIGRELAKGLKKGEIAKSIGKSAAFVSQHVTLLDLPGPIAVAFNSGRARDVTVVNELVTSFKMKPQEVTAWLADDSQDITRSAVKQLREFLDDKLSREQLDGDDEADGAQGYVDKRTKERTAPAKTGNPDRLRAPMLQVQFNQRPAQLLLYRRPTTDGVAWLRCDDNGQEFEAELAQVRLVALQER